MLWAILQPLTLSNQKLVLTITIHTLVWFIVITNLAAICFMGLFLLIMSWQKLSDFFYFQRFGVRSPQKFCCKKKQKKLPFRKIMQKKIEEQEEVNAKLLIFIDSAHTGRT